MRARHRLVLAVVLGVSCAGCNTVFGVDPGTPDGMIHIVGRPFTFSIAIDRGSGTLEHKSKGINVDLEHAFALDEDEVTVARFRTWLDAGATLPKKGDTLDPGGPYEKVMVWTEDEFTMKAASQDFGGSCMKNVAYAHDKTKTTFELAEPDYPMTCVRWAQAVAFCAFEHKRLPSNAEWQYAAQGGDDEAETPFSGAVSCANAIIDSKMNGEACGFPVKVGTAKGKSKDGLLDMGGSVTEWVWDGYDYEAGQPLDPTETDGFAGATEGGSRLLRGAEYFSAPEDAKIQNGHAFAGDSSAVSDVGFRCAKTLLPAD